MRIFSRLERWAARMRHVESELDTIENRIVSSQMLSAKMLIDRSTAHQEPIDIRSAEFRVFSQFGEDGIIQYLIRRAQVPSYLQTFVEFGVESYQEANTRFLLMNDNWRGLIMDGDDGNMAAVRHSPLYWRQDLTAISAFIDAENIDRLIEHSGFGAEIGLLSIDIDGNDYWVWERVEAVKPIIVIVEYNSLFGKKFAVTIPYDPKFSRAMAHYSYLYWGCSLKALELLGQRKGYALVGSNSAGNNAFFVRRDYLNGQPELTAEEAYVEARFRESRDREGRLNFLSGNARQREIADMPVVDLEQNMAMRLGDVLPLDRNP